ncbi:APC family permease [Nocardioides sp. NPDC006303]|uniref:APC family permease n=1 Tax=Nocardioides sp. NPDC006303 TaxID=3156747 RepID=UPI0033B44B7D
MTVANDQQRLRGRLGVVGLVFTVLAYNAPLAVMAGFAPLVIGLGNASGAPTTFLVLGVLLMLLAAGLVAMSRYMTSPGAFYSYIATGVGKAPGLGAAFIAFSAYFLIAAGSLIFGGIVVGSLIHDTLGGPDMPWWFWSIFMGVATSTFSMLNVDLSAKVLGVALVAEMIVVLGWQAAVGIDHGIGGIHWSSFTPSAFGEGNLTFALVFGILCFTGFEAVAVFREETNDPIRTVPRATYAAVLIIALMYSLGTLMYITAFGPAAAVETSAVDPTGSFVGSVQDYFGTAVVDVIAVMLCTSSFAGILAAQNVSSRYLYALGKDGVLPKALGEVHPKHGSPRNAAAVVAVGVAIVVAIPAFAGTAGVQAYAIMTGIGGFCLLALMTATAVSIVAFFRSAGHDATLFQSLIAPVLAFLGLATIFVMALRNMEAVTGLAPTGARIALALLVALVLGGVTLALYLRRKSPATYARIGQQDV